MCFETENMVEDKEDSIFFSFFWSKVLLIRRFSKNRTGIVFDEFFLFWFHILPYLNQQKILTIIPYTILTKLTYNKNEIP